MLCCGICCGNMSKRDYKVATTDGIELEPLGGPKPDEKSNGIKKGQCTVHYNFRTFTIGIII